VAACKFHCQLQKRKGNQLRQAKNAESHQQWKLTEDWDKPRRPTLLSLHLAMLKLLHIDFLLKTYIKSHWQDLTFQSVHANKKGKEHPCRKPLF
jgi:hypothetical protein